MLIVVDTDKSTARHESAYGRLALATASPRNTPDLDDLPTGCSVPASALKDLLPARQTELTAPSSPPSFVALGVDVQNYACSSTGTYTNTGEVAELYDISCVADKSKQTDEEYKKWATSLQTVQYLIKDTGKQPSVLGQLPFIPNPSPGRANIPKFDFTSNRIAGNSKAYAVSTRVGDIAAPSGLGNVDWQQYKRSCTPGKSADVDVKYTTQYYLFK
ncbi:unnamed protein product [Peniophora sp. CBMAI 1063]|nr:unnamed protein product [Peniophora sp. CBMAI 1063]